MEAKKVSGANHHLLWDPIVQVSIEKKIIWNDLLVIPLNSKEGAFFLNFILTIAYSKRYLKIGPNKMAPLASILWEGEQQVARPSLFFLLLFFISAANLTAVNSVPLGKALC